MQLDDREQHINRVLSMFHDRIGQRWKRDGGTNTCLAQHWRCSCLYCHSLKMLFSQ